MQALLAILLFFGCESFAPATRTLPRAARLRSAPAEAEIDLDALRDAVACAEGDCAARTYHVDQLKATLEAAIGDQLAAQKALDDARRALRDGEALDARARAEGPRRGEAEAGVEVEERRAAEAAEREAGAGGAREGGRGRRVRASAPPRPGRARKAEARSATSRPRESRAEAREAGRRQRGKGPKSNGASSGEK